MAWTSNQQYAYNYFNGQLGWSRNFSAAMVAALSGEGGAKLNTAMAQNGITANNAIANWSFPGSKLFSTKPVDRTMHLQYEISGRR